MLPYISIPSIEIFGPFSLTPFVMLVVIAIITGDALAYRRARQIGLNTRIMNDGILWAIAAGFIFAHWVLVIFYYPERVFENPIILLTFEGGMSSFGGFFGGTLGAFIYFKSKKAPFMPYIDAMLFGILPALTIVRLGCTITFDHPGRATDFFMGMVNKYEVVRHNLGFYEMLWLIIMTAVLYRLKNIRRFEGFHFALVILLYAPMRIFLETLRVGEKTYWGLTPTHYFSIIFLGLGVFLILRGLKIDVWGWTELRKKED